MKGGIGLMRKKVLLIGTNLTSICCVYKKKIVKDVRIIPNILAAIQIDKIATYDLERIKINLIFKQIIQILQPIVIDHLSPHLYYIIKYKLYTKVAKDNR